MTNLINLADFRRSRKVAETQQATPSSYDDAVRWANGDFDKLVAICKARAYWPTWVVHQLEATGKQPTPEQAATLQRLRTEAGPYDLSRRQRWIMWKIAVKTMTAAELVEAAMTSIPFADCRDIKRCVQNDLKKLVVAGHINESKPHHHDDDERQNVK